MVRFEFVIAFVTRSKLNLQEGQEMKFPMLRMVHRIQRGAGPGFVVIMFTLGLACLAALPQIARNLLILHLRQQLLPLQRRRLRRHLLRSLQGHRRGPFIWVSLCGRLIYQMKGFGPRRILPMRMAISFRLRLLAVFRGLKRWMKTLFSVQDGLTYRQPAGKRLFLSVSPLDKDRRGLAPYWENKKIWRCPSRGTKSHSIVLE